MKNHTIAIAAACLLTATSAFAQTKLSVSGSDQLVSGGTVTASRIVAGENGWLVVHRTDGMKPGPVVGHAPLKKGTNNNVSAILTEPVKKGEKLMLMLHSEQGGMKARHFRIYARRQGRWPSAG